jgi:hypothetical protein
VRPTAFFALTTLSQVALSAILLAGAGLLTAASGISHGRSGFRVVAF